MRTWLSWPHPKAVALVMPHSQHGKGWNCTQQVVAGSLAQQCFSTAKQKKGKKGDHCAHTPYPDADTPSCAPSLTWQSSPPTRLR